MRMRYLSPLLVTLFGLLLSASAQEATSFAKARGKAVTRTYAVADLVVPFSPAVANPVIQLPPPGATCAKEPCCADKAAAVPCPAKAYCEPGKACAAKDTCEDRLINLIQNTIAPPCWSCNGGAATMEFYRLGMALIVHAEAEVQEQVANLLQELRRMQDTCVALEVRFVSVADKFLERMGIQLSSDLCERIGIDFNAGTNGQPPAVAGPGMMPVAFLNEKQVTQFLEAIQGDQRTTVYASPKLTVLDGQTATIHTKVGHWNAGQAILSKCGDFALPSPHVETGTTPFTLCVRPLVSADRRTVHLNMQATVGNMNLSKVTAIPDGGTMVVGGWKRPCDMGSYVPFLGRLFKSPASESERVVLLVTPRVIVDKEEICPPKPIKIAIMQPPAPRILQADYQLKTAGPAMKAAEPFAAPVDRPAGSFRAQQVAKLLEMYHEACAGGHHDEARKLAAFALELDPTCFNKSRR